MKVYVVYGDTFIDECGSEITLFGVLEKAVEDEKEMRE